MRTLILLGSTSLLMACGEVVSSGAGGDAAPAPTAASISPDHGPFGGGIDVTITGTGFMNAESGDAVVLVGGLLSPSASVDGDDSVTFELPPGAQQGATVDVVVFNQNGLAMLPAAFTYNRLPVVLSVSPVLTRKAGGTNITITGRGFEALEAGTPDVTINGIDLVGVTVVDDTTITGVTGADALAQPLLPVDLVVTNDNGTATLEGGIQLTAPGLLAMGSGSNQSGTGLVYYINLDNGAVTPFTRLSNRVHECAVNSSGVMFGVTGAQGTPHRLGTIDLVSGQVTDIAGVTNGAAVAQRVNGLAFVGTNLYTVTQNDARLALLNQTTGVSTIVGGAVALSQASGIAFRDGASVYFMDNFSQTLDTIPVATGVLAAGPSTAGTSSNSVAALTIVGTTLYAAERFSPFRVFSVATNGALTPVATLPANIDGLCPTPPTF